MSDKEEETAVAEKRGRGRPKKPKSDEVGIFLFSMIILFHRSEIIF